MASLTPEGVSRRLSLLTEATSHLAEASRLLNDYEAAWSAEGFVHSISELVNAAHCTLETSIAILQDYGGESSKRRGAPREVPDLPDEVLGNAWGAEINPIQMNPRGR